MIQFVEYFYNEILKRNIIHGSTGIRRGDVKEMNKIMSLKINDGYAKEFYLELFLKNYLAYKKYIQDNIEYCQKKNECKMTEQEIKFCKYFEEVMLPNRKKINVGHLQECEKILGHGLGISGCSTCLHRVAVDLMNLYNRLRPAWLEEQKIKEEEKEITFKEFSEPKIQMENASSSGGSLQDDVFDKPVDKIFERDGVIYETVTTKNGVTYTRKKIAFKKND